MQKSISGSIIYDPYGSLIEWKSNKQSTVDRSTAEAEINTVAYTVEQVVLLSHNKNEVVEKVTNVTLSSTEKTVPMILLDYDNQVALTNLNKKQYEASNRHVETKYGWHLECLQKVRIRVEYVPTTFIKTDEMTKPLGRMKHT